MNQKQLEAILRGKKTLVSYFSYPTGHYSDSLIAECDTNDESSPIHKVCKDVINEAKERLGFSKGGNKEAVKCIVEGLAKPVYFMLYDNKYKITQGVKDNGGHKEYIIKQEVVNG